MKRKDFERADWREESGYLVKNLKPDSIVLVNSENKQGKVVIWSGRYGQLELKFSLSKFKSVQELEIFCLKFIINQEEND